MFTCERVLDDDLFPRLPAFLCETTPPLPLTNDPSLTSPTGPGEVASLSTTSCLSESRL